MTMYGMLNCSKACQQHAMHRPGETDFYRIIKRRFELEPHLVKRISPGVKKIGKDFVYQHTNFPLKCKDIRMYLGS